MIEAIFLYSIRSAFVLTLLYVPYMLILRKESFFRLNRAVLLLILLFSVMLPMLDVHFLSLDKQPVVQAAKEQMVQVGIPVEGYHLLPEFSVQAQHVPVQVSWFHVVSVLFCFVAMAMLLWRIMQILRMTYIVRRGNLWHEVEDGIDIHCHAGEVSPFSWMNHVVISERDFHENGREILLHETGHIRSLHSWDLLLLSAVQILQWWNPLAYVFASSLRDVHEYEADDYVLRQGISARDYQLLLIKKAVGTSSYTFANNFDHSLTLKRITMMQKSKSSVWMRSKVLYIIPMATLALSAFATSEPTSLSGNEVAKDEDKVIKISSSVQDGDVISPLAENDVVYLLDGKKASNDEVRNLPTLDIASMTVIKNAEVSKSLGHAGKTVIAIETKTKLDTLKVNIVENPACNAQFKGGDMALMQWLRKNVRYPQASQSLGVQGKITVQFYVSETGRIFNVRAISIDKNEPQSGQTLEELIVQAYAKDMAKLGKTLSAEETKAHKVAVMALVKEAERVVREMPAWEPAFIDKDKTKPCTVKFAMPIMFRLG
ncbi:MAG: M56 family metallopeptidase [Bacteroidaceae bacterium]|nr:M56 family metallopeptidase [Bacteroidaceae bacterium]